MGKQEYGCFPNLQFHLTFIPQYPHVLWAEKNFQVRTRPKKLAAPPYLPHWEFQIGLFLFLPGGIVGPTFACIISSQVSLLPLAMGKLDFQFKALMDGDRFFYPHTAGPEIRCSAVISNVSKDPFYCQATHRCHVGADKTAPAVRHHLRKHRYSDINWQCFHPGRAKIHEKSRIF